MTNDLSATFLTHKAKRSGELVDIWTAEDEKIQLSLLPGDTDHDRVGHCLTVMIIIMMIFSFGGRATSDQCPAGVILMSIQSIMGVIIEVQYVPFKTSELLQNNIRFCPACWLL